MDAGIRTVVDDDDRLRPGEKYYKWEMYGVPLRIEVGPREAESKTVTFVRRDTFEKSKAELKDLPTATKALFTSIQENIAARSRRVLEERLTTATNIEELRSYMDQKKLVRINWCGDFNCAERLKEQVSGEIRGTLWDHKEEPTGPCIACGDPAKCVAYVSRTY
jgi:prolyl-tRNA synthetase